MSFVAARVVGELPLSIATSLALESLLGISTEERVNTKPKNVDALWVNLYTLFRNFTDAMEGTTYLDVPESELHYGLMEEVKQIAYLALGYSRNIQVVFYVCEHEALGMRYPKALIREPRTDRQVMYRKAASIAVKRLADEIEDDHALKLLRFRHEITGNYSTKVLLLTHQAIDLLSAKQFSDCRLLESHTGSVKPKLRWFTKLASHKDNPHLTFSKLVLQVFGDAEHFKPFPVNITRALAALAIERRWTAITTREKQRFDITHYLTDLKPDQIELLLELV